MGKSINTHECSEYGLLNIINNPTTAKLEYKSIGVDINQLH